MEKFYGLIALFVIYVYVIVLFVIYIHTYMRFNEHNNNKKTTKIKSNCTAYLHNGLIFKIMLYLMKHNLESSAVSL